MDKSSLFSLPSNEFESRQIPTRVTHILRFPSGLAFPVCPGCGVTLEREYQRYCDRCGQCLSWKQFSRATVVLWSERHNQLAVQRMGQAVAFPSENNNVGVVSEQVGQSDGDEIVAKNCVPLGGLQIEGDDQLLALITV